MGKAEFSSKKIPTNFTAKEAIDQKLPLEDEQIEVNCVSLGNPHCVILKNDLNIDEIKKYGPMIEHHLMFPNKINVQFAKVLTRKEVDILIWERGAGFTLASGSSSYTVDSSLYKKGLVDNKVKINMPGGTLTIKMDKEEPCENVGWSKTNYWRPFK